MATLRWSNNDVARRVTPGIQAAVAFNRSISQGISPAEVQARRPPPGAREWLSTPDGKRLALPQT